MNDALRFLLTESPEPQPLDSVDTWWRRHLELLPRFPAPADLALAGGFRADRLGFAFASALGGLAPTAGMLFAARALQGAFAALLAPAALSLITVTFVAPKERARAFGVFGAISGGGAAIGLILGGILTEYASWRWCLGVNVPIALLTAAAAVYVVHESKAPGDTSYDIPGAFLSINLIQANLITPVLLGNRLTLNPVAIFVGLAFWFFMWGVPGAFIAVPVLAALKVICDHTRPLAAIGEFLGQRDDHERRAVIRA